MNPTLHAYIDLSCSKRAANLFSTSASRTGKVEWEGKRGATFGPVYSHPWMNVFPSLFVALTTAPGVPLVEVEEQREPPMPSKGNLFQSPSAFPAYTASRIPHHRPPFVHQWRARVHVHVRTHTRDHASPPRTRGGVGRITKRRPARHLASERQSRSPRDHVAKLLSNRFAKNCSASIGCRRDCRSSNEVLEGKRPF